MCSNHGHSDPHCSHHSNHPHPHPHHHHHHHHNVSQSQSDFQNDSENSPMAAPPASADKGRRGITGRLFSNEWQKALIVVSVL